MSMKVSQESPDVKYNVMFIKVFLRQPWHLNEPNLSQI